MEKYKYQVDRTNKFKKEFKKMQKRPEYDYEEFEFVVKTLRKGEQLPAKYHNHLLEPKSERCLGMPYKK